MISRWLIFFSLWGAWTAPGRGAAVTGAITLRDSRVEEVARKGNYAGVVVSLAAPARTPSEPAPARHFRMLQKDKTFTPHVLAIPAGSIVDFPNADPIFHSAFSSYSGQIFDVGLYPPGQSKSVRFTRPGVVRVFCNIHPDMSAVILVLATPYYATTGNNGAFSIEVPPGEYELSVFHERSTDAALQTLARRITVPAGGLDLGSMAISESGYVAAPHKNKYGNDYPPASPDGTVYPGARK